MFSERIFPEYNGRVIDLQNISVQDSTIALLAAVFSDNTNQSDQQIYSWLQLQLHYNIQPRDVQDVLDYSSIHMLPDLTKKYVQGFVAHLIFVMVWALKSNDVKDAGVSKAYYLTQKILENKYQYKLTQKTIKKYYQLQEHVVHIWVAIFSYQLTKQIAENLVRNKQSFERNTVIEILQHLMTPRFLHDSASYHFYGTDLELPRTRKNSEPVYLVDRFRARSIAGIDMFHPSKLEMSKELKKLCDAYTRVEIE